MAIIHVVKKFKLHTRHPELGAQYQEFDVGPNEVSDEVANHPWVQNFIQDPKQAKVSVERSRDTASDAAAAKAEAARLASEKAADGDTDDTLAGTPEQRLAKMRKKG